MTSLSQKVMIKALLKRARAAGKKLSKKEIQAIIKSAKRLAK